MLIIDITQKCILFLYIFISQFTSTFLKNLLLNHIAVTIHAAWSDYFEKKKYITVLKLEIIYYYNTTYLSLFLLNYFLPMNQLLPHIMQITQFQIRIHSYNIGCTYPPLNVFCYELIREHVKEMLINLKFHSNFMFKLFITQFKFVLLKKKKILFVLYVLMIIQFHKSFFYF